MKIVRTTAVPLDIPMKKAFGIAGGSQELCRNVLVSVELDSGMRGYGEAAPLPAFNGETQEAALGACLKASPFLVGKDPQAWRTLAGGLAEQSAHSSSAACALETAIVDALTRALGTSMRAFFGGEGTRLVTDVTITTGTVAQAAEEARAFAPFRTLKIKVGGSKEHDVELDIARVLAVAHARPDAVLLLDANGGLCVDDAVRLALALRSRGVVPALFEQPVAPDMEAMAEVRSKCGLPIALDESITRPEDVFRAHKAGAADAVNVKLMKSGIARALDIVAAARTCGFQTMIGGMVESRLAMGTSASLAAGLGGFAIVDLDTPMFLAEDPFDGGYTQQGEWIDLAGVERGHGCVPRR
jgi:L-alanine-DL-glutamate epimerase-like enolase superfamily enzyme